MSLVVNWEGFVAPIEAAGRPDATPEDHFWAGFTIGTIVGGVWAGPIANAGMGALAADTLAAEAAMAEVEAELALTTRCFAEGTGVQTEEGMKAIEEIEPGERVWARDPDTGDEGWHAVTRVLVHAVAGVLALELSLGAGSEHLGTTPEHPFFERTGAWTAAGDLEAGDEIYTSSGAWAVVLGSTWIEGTRLVYNLEVEGAHTYFVGETGAWVHNTCPLTAADLGWPATVDVDATWSVRGDVATARFAYIGGDFGPPMSSVRALRGTIPELASRARAGGATRLHIDATPLIQEAPASGLAPRTGSMRAAGEGRGTLRSLLERAGFGFRGNGSAYTDIDL